MPDQGDYNAALWQKMIDHHCPNQPDDIILRLLPLAKGIENHVRDHQEELQNNIAEKIYTTHKIKFSEKYDEIVNPLNQQEWVDEKLNAEAKKITKTIKNDFDTYLRNDLKLPLKGALTKEQKENLILRRKNLTAEDYAEQEKIKKQVESHYRSRAIETFNEASINIVQVSKEEYINSQFKIAHKTLEAMIEDKVKNLLSSNTPIAVLEDYASHLIYKRAIENPSAAKIFFSQYIREEVFNDYLSLKPKDSHLIPPLCIEGEEINEAYKSYSLYKLDPTDPRAAILGRFTSSCQNLGEEGHDPTVHGITDIYGGFYTLGEEKLDQKTIRSMCWAWRNKADYICFDSIESQIDFRKNKILIQDFFVYTAWQLNAKTDVAGVVIGQGGKTPKQFFPLNPIKSQIPIDYKSYRDSKYQYLIAYKEIPNFLFYWVYKINNPDSKINNMQIPKKLSKEAIFAWFDLCEANGQYYYMKCLKPFLNQAGLSKNFIEERRELYNEWYTYLSSTLFDLSVLQDFIQKEINLTISNVGEDTLILKAAKTHQWPIIDCLIKHQADQDQTEEEIKIILMHAAKDNQLDIVKYYIQKGFPINYQNELGETLLHFAASKNHFELVNYLVEQGANINSKDCSHITPLHLAATTNDLSLVTYLVEHGANVNAQDQWSRTAIHFAMGEIINEKNFKITQYLTTQGTQANVKEKISEETALHIAAFLGDASLMDYLIRNGWNIHERNKYGNTPLFCAIGAGHLEAVQYLVQWGANIEGENDQGKSVLHYAIQAKQLEIAFFLINEGADIYKLDKDSNNLLHYASEIGSEELVYYFVEIKKVNIHAINKKGYSVLDLSILNGNINLVNYLIEKGAIYNQGIINRSAMSFNLLKVLNLLPNNTKNTSKNHTVFFHTPHKNDVEISSSNSLLNKKA